MGPYELIGWMWVMSPFSKSRYGHPPKPEQPHHPEEEVQTATGLSKTH
jgi:hypothetical protein